MIERISRLHSFRIFRDFRWPSDLRDFGRYNLIYGWNGSGKTTLGHVFQALELRVPPDADQVTLRVNGQNLGKDDFAECVLPVRVFNRQFVEKSVFPVGGELSPIFVLGPESGEKQEQVKQLNDRLSAVQTSLGNAKADTKIAVKELDGFCTTQASQIKAALRSNTANPYNNYNKGLFSPKIEEISARNDWESLILDDALRTRLVARSRSEAKQTLNPLAYETPDVVELGRAVSTLLSTTVVSSAIQALQG